MSRAAPATPAVVAEIAAAILLAGCAPGDSETAADYVFAGGAVYTVDDAQPWAEAVAVRGDEIVHVGDEAGLEPYLGRETRRVDLEDDLLLPGFIDTHVHPISGGAYATALSLDTFGTVEEWIDAIAAYAAENPDDEVIFGYGFLATTFGPAGPMRQQIDAVVPERPVLIMDEGLHAAWANTAALERLDLETLVRGLTRDAAYQLRMEDEIGSIEAGKRADLVVLDQNIFFGIDPYAIHETGVVMTLLDGAVVYERGETDAGS